MAPVPMQNDLCDQDAMGCRVDRRQARLSRAMRRRGDSSGPRSASPMTEVGAAICGSGPISHSAVSGGGNVGSSAQQAYASELAAQMAEKRSRMVAEREERRRGDRTDDVRVQHEGSDPPEHKNYEANRQRDREAQVLAREDSLTRFLAEQGQGPTGAGGPSSSPNSRKPPAGGRSVSQPPRAPSPSGAAAGPPAVRSSPFATQDDRPGSQQQRGRRVYGNGPSSTPWAVGGDEQAAPAAARGGYGQRESTPEVPGLQRRSAIPPRPPASINDGYGGAARGSANAYANGANQNCGNVITDRPTSRVLQPPGGGSSIKFY
eukprot:TRINITY_DN37986_c0_g1_i1.p1 TRINITY_DN37986_c0_g1~~TRINITY_DN37986_c0_g1_i1.p1  ORF type:complete len:344 (+),score=34.94 TRINITY_DN37986_c0_g1_i1:78-1034(+)